MRRRTSGFPGASRQAALALGLALIILVGAKVANSQFGSVMEIFPGSTFSGDVNRGQGILAGGMGQFRLDLAEAQAMQADTMMRVSEFLVASREEARERHAKRVKAERAFRNSLREQKDQRISKTPTETDIMNGDTLNRMVEDLADYRVPLSILRTSAVDLPVELIRASPYHYPAIGGVISIQRMSPELEDWPLALRGETAERPRQRYEEAIDSAFDKVYEGKLTLGDIKTILKAIDELRIEAKRTTPGTNQIAFYEVQVFLHQLETSAKSLQGAATSVAIKELDGFYGTSVYDLATFLQRFNLRFAAAKTPSERQTYRRLYDVLVEQREVLRDFIEVQEDRELARQELGLFDDDVLEQP